MAARSILSLLSLLLIAGGVLLMFLILLSGAIDDSPVNKWYLLQADTSGIPSAPDGLARWSYWNVRPVDGDTSFRDDNGYTHVHPAFPLDPAGGRTFDTTVNVPENFVANHGYYFYMTRFMFAFMLIALFWAVMALFTGLLALCTRIGAYLSGLLAFLALFFQLIQCSLMTAAYVKGRNNFRNDGKAADIGKYAFGFEWAAAACFLLSTILFCVGGGARKESTKSYSSGRRGFFKGKRSRSTRSRGSFVRDKEYST